MYCQLSSFINIITNMFSLAVLFVIIFMFALIFTQGYNLLEDNDFSLYNIIIKFLKQNWEVMKISFRILFNTTINTFKSLSDPTYINDMVQEQIAGKLMDNLGLDFDVKLIKIPQIPKIPNLGIGQLKVPWENI